MLQVQSRWSPRDVGFLAAKYFTTWEVLILMGNIWVLMTDDEILLGVGAVNVMILQSLSGVPD